MTTFLLIRHAATDAVGNRVVGRMPGVQLNAEGRKQLDALAQRLAGQHIDRLYSSPLDRARETAEAIAVRAGLQIEFADELLEIHFGDWTGQTYQELTAREDWKTIYTFRSATRPPHGELTLETQARTVAFVLRVRDEFPTATIALVSHGDVLKSIVTYFLGIPLDLLNRLEISPASISEIALDDREVRVRYVNQRSGDAQ